MDSAAVYRTRRRLESRGMVFSRWETKEKGPPRRVYELTDGGREHLRDWLEVMMEEVRHGLEGLLGKPGQT